MTSRSESANTGSRLLSQRVDIAPAQHLRNRIRSAAPDQASTGATREGSGIGGKTRKSDDESSAPTAIDPSGLLAQDCAMMLAIRLPPDCNTRNIAGPTGHGRAGHIHPAQGVAQEGGGVDGARGWQKSEGGRDEGAGEGGVIRRPTRGTMHKSDNGYHASHAHRHQRSETRDRDRGSRTGRDSAG